MIIALVVILTTLSLLSVFQFALAAGAPLGWFAWGGHHAVLPVRLRIGSVVAVVIYALFAVVATSKAGVITVVPPGTFLNVCLWVMTAYLVVGAVMNALSKSKYERYVMTPLTMVLAVCFLVVTLA